MRGKQTVKSWVEDRAKMKNVAKFGASSRGYTIFSGDDVIVRLCKERGKNKIPAIDSRLMGD